METSTYVSKRSIAVAGLISFVGIAFATVSVMYVAGMFGISASLAGQIVSAVEVGGIALAIVMGLLSGGVGAAAVATARWAIARWGRNIAIA